MPECNGIPATIYVRNGRIVGGPQNGQFYMGFLNGGNGQDVIVGTANNEIIHGGNGADIICGRGGNDLILGQNGPDALYGQGGNDLLNGGNGQDLCRVGAGGGFAVQCEL